jgi:2-polyprenyl-3-methyl-5-hydroxy-6-metoxy-1,4-benzoquinol methylase
MHESQLPSAASPDFIEFAARLTSQQFLEGLAQATGLSADALHARVTMAVAEAAQTLRILEGVEVAPGDRILEVGAGLGVASAFLAELGFAATGLEPGGVAFEEHLVVAKQLALLAEWKHELLTVAVEELDVGVHGTFSLVFSNNVVEHVESSAVAFRSMASVLAEGGLMVHSCPNYTIPYEPHFGLPLLPMRPRLTARFLPSRVRDSALWRSLNFIRARDVIATSRDLGLDVHFRSGSLATSLERLGSDAEFRSRHRILGAISVVLRWTGMLALLRKLPSTWSTPMDFLMCLPETDPVRIELWRQAQ